MNMIVNRLSDILESRVGKVEFNTDFRISILFELLMQDDTVSEQNKIMQSLRLYYPRLEQITNVNKAIEDVIWFYRCGKELANSNKKGKNGKQGKQIYSYEFDDDYIFCSFMQQYKIDLQDIKYLHWWKFKAMFDGLNENTKMAEIMGYRAMDISKIKDKEEKKRYKNLQEAYSLPDMRTAEQKEADFGRAFW